MKRGGKTKLTGILQRLRNEYKRCVKKGHCARAREIKAFLKTHYTLAGIKNAA